MNVCANSERINLATTSPNELRAAALAVKDLVKTPNIVDNIQRWYAIAPHAGMLAEHYLSTLPPDAGLLITEERLLPLGFSAAGINGFSILLPPVKPDAAIAELFLEWPDEGSDVWGVSLLQGYPDEPRTADDHVTLTSVSMRTIPQLLALLEHLGVPIPSAKEKERPSDE